MAEVGTKLIFENDQVRVWEFTLQPGESTGSHHHELDYFFYPIEGGTLEVTRSSGVTQATLNVGEVYYRKAGDKNYARIIKFMHKAEKAIVPAQFRSSSD